MPLPKEPLVNRPLVGILALVGLTWGLGLVMFDSFESAWGGSLIRVGLLMGVLWIALPTSTRPAAWSGISPWSTLSVFGVILMAVRSRKPVMVLLSALGVAILGFMLRPKRPRKTTSQSTPRGSTPGNSAPEKSAPQFTAPRQPPTGRSGPTNG